MNPWLIVGFLIALIAVGTGGYLKGEKDGKTASEAAWQTREAGINAAVAIKIKDANDKVREEEHAKAEKQASISGTLQDKLKEKDNALNIALNAVRAGTVRLSIPAACPAIAGNPADRAPAGAGGRDANSRVELPQEVAGFFIGEATRADKIVEQLTACQSVIRSDRAK